MFKYKDLSLVYDVNSGSLHRVDELGWDVIELLLKQKTYDELKELLEFKYPKNEINEALRQVEDLNKAGLLFTLPHNYYVQDRITSYPVKALCLFISESCNLNCRYCFAKEHGAGSSHMSWAVGKNAVDLLLNSESAPFVEIDFFGGEPLLNFDLIKKIVEYAKKQGSKRGKHFNFTLTTNALALTDHIIEYLNKENISVILSLDGRPETHDVMRPAANGEGTYNRTVKNIDNYVKQGSSDYFIRGTFTSNNLYFSREVEHMLELGYRSLSLEPVVAEEDKPYALRKEHLPVLEKQYDRLVDLFLIKRDSGDPFRFYHFDLDLEEGPCLFKRLSSCGAGVEYLAVSANGDVYPCHQFCGEEDFCMGNLLQEDFVPDSNLSNMMGKAALEREECGTCWARYLCGRGCAATSYFLGGSLKNTHSLYCALQRIRLERALYLQAV